MATCESRNTTRESLGGVVREAAPIESKAENQVAPRSVFALQTEPGRYPNEEGEGNGRHEDSSAAAVMVMETAHHRLGHDTTTLRRFHHTRFGSIVVQRHVRPRSMILSPA
jgi:hypothetical protein